MTLSLYYADPDGNLMELQVDLLDADRANEFMAGPAFDANPVGEPFDPEELAAHWNAGQDVTDIVLRSDPTTHPDRREADRPLRRRAGVSRPFSMPCKVT
jgi:hypothetical protein